MTNNNCPNCASTLCRHYGKPTCLYSGEVCSHCANPSTDEIDISTIGECNKPQPMSIKNNLPAIWDLVKEDIEERDKIGEKKYNTRLQAFNGRDALVDAYQEALDLVVYLRQAIFERDNKNE